MQVSHPPPPLLILSSSSRTIQSGILWRDSAVLHVAYYDGYVRVGIINENYEDMLLIKVRPSSPVKLPFSRGSP